MSDTVQTLIDMGFSKEKAELALSKFGNNIGACLEWILSSNDNDNSSITPSDDQSNNTLETQPIAKSKKCNDCGKLFITNEEVEFHATKSGHVNFSESTEEKKPLTEEEKKEQLAKIEAKLRQRRLEREAKEKEEALEKERNRIRSGKEMLEAKKKYDENEMKKIIEQKKREKEEERLAKQKVREQIEQDKLARKLKFSGQTAVVKEDTLLKSATINTATIKKPLNNTQVQLQIKLTNGSSLMQSFGVKEPLSAVRLYIELNRKDEDGPFNLMRSYPRRVFNPEEYDIPLESLGFAPRDTLIVIKL